MSRRLLLAFGVFVAAFWIACGATNAARPNVLFIVADDLNCCIGPYGDRVAKTEHLDRLAVRGFTFRRAYCQQTVCNPSRSSFLTGLRPDTVGVDDLRKGFRETAPNGKQLVTLPQHFKANGYFCQNIGKIFHNMGETQDRRSWSIDEVLFKGTHADDTLFANRPQPNQKSFKAPVSESEDVPDIVYRDGQIANLAAATIRDHVGSDRPFFLAVGFWRPHLPFVAPRKYWDLYDPNEIPMPEPFVPPTDVPDIALHQSREIRGYGHVPKDRDFTAQEIRHYRHGYYASISYMDAQIGEILDALNESGQADNTIVVFTSDHGFHLGEHGLWGKTSNFEKDARVPLLIVDPRRPDVAGRSSSALAELVDLYPTLAELVEIESDLPKNLEGVSLVPVLENPAFEVKDVAFTQQQHPLYGSRKNWKAWGYSMRTARWRYTEWRSIADGSLVGRELYDHDQDPGETRNLTKASSHQKTVRRLSSILALQFPEPEDSSDGR